MTAAALDRRFDRELAATRLVLTEGSVYERLRRNPEIVYDDQIAHAGLIYDPRTADILGDVHREYIHELITVPAPTLAEQIHAVASRYWLTLLGGCCGTGTEHIAAIARRFEENA